MKFIDKRIKFIKGKIQLSIMLRLKFFLIKLKFDIYNKFYVNEIKRTLSDGIQY
jgi:hypothetical protein